MHSNSPRLAVAGPGRLGTALAPVLGADGPFGRGFEGAGYDAVLLCVPDAEIAAAASAVAPGPVVGHTSGATALDVLAPHADAFGLHPLMTVPSTGARFDGVPAAIGATSDRARETAHALAARAGLRAFPLADEDRAAYHAAASIAANFLVTLEWTAEELLPADRAVLVPLVRAAVENWAAHGPRQALTGPIARGDEQTVMRQRAAVAERVPAALAMFDALADRTRTLAA